MSDERPDRAAEIGQLPEHDVDDGRPTGLPDADGLRAGRSSESAPTVAPEERGETPATEHAPGGDL
jgi:hypothetical protein